MRAVYKYELRIGEVREMVIMSVGAKVLAFGNQGERAMLWAEVDPAREPEERFFTIYGTGHQLPDEPGQYIGTAQFANGRLIFHAYEDAER